MKLVYGIVVNGIIQKSIVQKMSPEENPPEHLEPESPQSKPDHSMYPAENPSSADNREPVEASMVDASQPAKVARVEPVMAQAADPTNAGAGSKSTGGKLLTARSVPRDMENMAANGGVIGALVLGTWCVIGSFITNWSIINGLIGLLMGLWGLTSRKRKAALIGIALCLLGISMCMVHVSELINTYFENVDENQ